VKAIIDYAISGLLFALSVALLFALSVAFLGAMSLPEAHFSNSTGECVEVINHDERFNFTCETLPDKYTHVWVQ
jgi:hypothetical protein